MSAKRLTIALAGNPNSGKTTVFNNLTGTRQKVGNWPGVTVEKKEGRVSFNGIDLTIVDLPGTYSLTPFSIEEVVARNYLLDERPDVVLDIIDASNLERSLYLATQIRELDCKVLFVLNMADVAEQRGTKIDARKMSELLDVPVVFTVGNRGEGMQELLRRAVELAGSPGGTPRQRRVKYSQDIEESIARLLGFMELKAAGPPGYDRRWTAIKLLEEDKIVTERLVAAAPQAGMEILQAAQALRRHLAERFDEEPQIVMTAERYGFIAGIVREVQSSSTQQRVDVSRTIDLVLTHRLFGFPIFIFFIWAMFQLTFTLGEYPVQAIEAGVEGISATAGAMLPEGLLRDLVVNGIIAGVGSVIVFLPNILILFFCIALFEDTGYMARSAFLMDKIMHLIGLHGKSFIPMLMGFGCNVPAIMAARTLESEKDRILTILITPFMSCSAKLPVYVVLAGAFFGPRAGSVIFGLYLLGIVLSIITGRLFRSTLLKGADAPFVMELPPYRMPMAKSLLIHMWDRSKIFLTKMGKVILVGSVVIWALSSFPRPPASSEAGKGPNAAPAAAARTSDAGGQADLEAAQRRAQKAAQTEYSLLGRIGRLMAPVFEPLGIEWRGGVALLSGFVAKEIVVSTLGVLYATGEGEEDGDLEKALMDAGMTPLSALAMMVFVLLYLPCFATTAAIRRETGSTRWMLFSIGYSTAVAWLMALFVFQGGRLIGLS
ncbi:MAG: ferrous iron transport protein B [Desulfobacterales bacterium]|jgi:ferrous iron transport protein B|nr:ferrous iron transport protein B [Desulfobacterales bacterium]